MKLVSEKMYSALARLLPFLFLHTNISKQEKQLLHSIRTQRTFTYLPSLFKQKNCHGQLTFLSQYFIWPLSLKHHNSTQLYCSLQTNKKGNKKYSKLNRPCISVLLFSYSLLHKIPLPLLLCHSFLLAIQVASLSLSLPSFSFCLACPN